MMLTSVRGTSEGGRGAYLEEAQSTATGLPELILNIVKYKHRLQWF